MTEDVLNCDTAKKNTFEERFYIRQNDIHTKKDHIHHNMAHGFYHTGNYTPEKSCKISCTYYGLNIIKY